MPKVSICVPNLNTRPFLPERFETIFNQTFTDWELIVYDSYSDDGSWEYIQELAAREPRMRISQGPREGIYPGWNYCIRQAQGEYVYIATSDDTMSPDFLEKMVAALDAHPECDLAHCCATFIDEKSQPTDWKWDAWPFAKYFGEAIKAKHIRPPGHDTVLALTLKTPYFSITQVLIRRSLFERCGYFEKRWGAYGDYEWQMRATLLTSTIHVPEYLATWRIHPQQASLVPKVFAARRNGWFVQMADGVIDFSRKWKVPGPHGLPRRVRKFLRVEQIQEIWRNQPGRVRKLLFLIRNLPADPAGTLWFLQEYFRGKTGRSISLEKKVRLEIEALGIQHPVVVGSDVTNVVKS